MYLDFALSEAAIWSANFRDLAASVTRMAILARLGPHRRADGSGGDRGAQAAMGRG